jgi:hypothetical protein
MNIPRMFVAVSRGHGDPLNQVRGDGEGAVLS